MTKATKRDENRIQLVQIADWLLTDIIDNTSLVVRATDPSKVVDATVLEYATHLRDNYDVPLPERAMAQMWMDASQTKRIDALASADPDLFEE